jgi:hypothetical protein
MEHVLKLIQERNSYLRKFYTINKAELFRLGEGDFTRLEFFYKNRENLLDMISHMESSIETKLKVIPVAQAISPTVKSEVREELDFKDQIISEILKQDVEILSIIEKTKNQIIKELQAVGKTKQAVGSYHSESILRKRNHEKGGV